MVQNKKNKIKNIIIAVLAINLAVLSLDRFKLYMNNKTTEFNNAFIDRSVGTCLVKVTNMKYACGDRCPELFRIDQVIACEGDSMFFINKEMTIIYQREELMYVVDSSLTHRFIFEGVIQSNNLGLLRMLVSNVTLAKNE